DGRDDDEVWRQAPVITQFRQWQPVEDGEPRFRTVAKVAYDTRNFYVFVRAFDPRPDSILKPLSRRDVFSASDRIWVMIDSYHDRRTGYEFGVNPVGAKLDLAISNDGNEDDAWDAVWDVATTLDSLGWTAEFRIPLSQLRYPESPSHTFGLMLMRDIYRYTERVSWPLLRRSRSGFPSQFGEVTGLDGLGSPRRLEVAPYVVTKNVSLPTAAAFDRSQKVTAGANIKYGVTSNLTLDGTVNPDFGQVGADTTIEPQTNYSVLRLQQDLRGSESGVGLLFTAVNRALDPASEPFMRRNAHVGALDTRHRFAHGTYEVSASLDVTRVAGTAQAIAATQR